MHMGNSNSPLTHRTTGSELTFTTRIKNLGTGQTVHEECQPHVLQQLGTTSRETELEKEKDVADCPKHGKIFCTRDGAAWHHLPWRKPG